MKDHNKFCYMVKLSKYNIVMMVMIMIVIMIRYDYVYDYYVRDDDDDGDDDDDDDDDAQQLSMGWTGKNITVNIQLNNYDAILIMGTL